MAAATVRGQHATGCPFPQELHFDMHVRYSHELKLRTIKVFQLSGVKINNKILKKESHFSLETD
jgi:hypothetical protein